MTFKFWDTDCTATDAALARMMRALVVVGGRFTDSMTLAPVVKSSRGVSVFLRVAIPEGREAMFRSIARAELVEPPRVSV